MTEIKTISEIIKWCEIDSENDYTGFWQIAGYAKRHFNLSKKQEIEDKTLEITSALLEADFLIGDLKKPPEGFIPWEDQTPGYARSRINREWSALDHPLWPGDICWFRKKSDYLRSKSE